MPPRRDYSAEFAARQAQAQRLGFTGYKQQRNIRRELLDPTTGHGYEAARGETGSALWGAGISAAEQAYDYYWPTNTRRPSRKYTQMARYDRVSQRMEVIFRDGTPFTYENVHPTQWDKFRRSGSTYDFIRGGQIIGGWVGGPEEYPELAHGGGWGSDAYEDTRQDAGVFQGDDFEGPQETPES